MNCSRRHGFLFWAGMRPAPEECAMVVCTSSAPSLERPHVLAQDMTSCWDAQSCITSLVGNVSQICCSYFWMEWSRLTWRKYWVGSEIQWVIIKKRKKYIHRNISYHSHDSEFCKILAACCWTHKLLPIYITVTTQHFHSSSDWMKSHNFLHLVVSHCTMLYCPVII